MGNADGDFARWFRKEHPRLDTGFSAERAFARGIWHAAIAHQAPRAKPVVYQQRLLHRGVEFIGWTNCSKQIYERGTAKIHSGMLREVRALTVIPSPVPAD